MAGDSAEYARQQLYVAPYNVPVRALAEEVAKARRESLSGFIWDCVREKLNRLGIDIPEEAA